MQAAMDMGATAWPRHTRGPDVGAGPVKGGTSATQALPGPAAQGQPLRRNSMRRLRARPSAVSLLLRGRSGPAPEVVSEAGGMPLSIR